MFVTLTLDQYKTLLWTAGLAALVCSMNHDDKVKLLSKALNEDGVDTQYISTDLEPFDKAITTVLY